MAQYKVQGPDGVQHVIEGPDGASDQEVIQQAQNLFAPSKLESVGRGALNNFPLAKQAVSVADSALTGSDYSQNMADSEAKAQAAKAANPVSYGIGATAGSVAPALIPGVGEIEGAAALGAAQGISDTDLAKTPVSQIASRAAMGAGTGAALNKAGGYLASKLEGPLQNIAYKKSVKTLGGIKGLGKYTPEEELALGEFAWDHGLVKGNTEGRLAQAQGVKSAYGRMIQELGEESAPTGGAINTEPLHEEAKRWAPLIGTEAKQQATTYVEGIKNIGQLGDNPTFEQVGELKRMYGKMAFDSNHGVKNQAASDVYHILADHQKAIIDTAPDQYKSALYGYSKSAEIADSLEDKLGLERNGGTGGTGGMIGSQIKKLPGVVRAPLGVGLAASGHSIYAAMAALPEILDPALHAEVATGVVKALPAIKRGVTAGGTNAVVSTIMGKLQSNPQSLGKYAKPLAQAAQSGGSEGIAAFNFIWTQRDPSYSKIINGEEERSEDDKR